MNRADNLRPSDQAKQADNVIPFPKRDGPPEGPVSREGLQWYVDHPKEAAAEGIKPWQLKIVAHRLNVLDALGPEPEAKPYTPEEIAEIVAEVEKATGKRVVRVTTTTDVLRRDDSADEAFDRQSDIYDLPFHPAADLFPMMDKAELEALAENIATLVNKRLSKPSMTATAR